MTVLGFQPISRTPMRWIKSLNLRRIRKTSQQYDESGVCAAERKKFVAAGLDYGAAMVRLNEALARLGWGEYSESLGVGSIHWVLFAALSAQYQMRRILEIGTYDGETTQLLSQLFPAAHITTVDLPHGDPRFIELYDRRDPKKRQAFIDRQRANTRGSNIELVLSDSFLLPARLQPGFDLIWVDGGHNYPVIAWDLCNAFHLCAANGWVLCDDVLACPEAENHAFVSRDSFEVLEYLREHTPVEVRYFLKRHGARWSVNPKRRKFVGTLRKLGA
jgi:hypothetical protein